MSICFTDVIIIILVWVLYQGNAIRYQNQTSIRSMAHFDHVAVDTESTAGVMP